MFSKLSLPFPDSTMAKKENKEWYENFCEMNVGKTILNDEEFKKIKEIQKSVFSNKIAFDLLSSRNFLNPFISQSFLLLQVSQISLEYFLLSNTHKFRMKEKILNSECLILKIIFSKYLVGGIRGN
jgi:hypothetical protein